MPRTVYATDLNDSESSLELVALHPGAKARGRQSTFQTGWSPPAHSDSIGLGQPKFDMMNLHDILPFMNEATLTERGQISVPAALRKKMGLRAGQRLKFAAVSEREFRVFAENDAPPGPMAMRGYARKLRGGPTRRTSAWMKELREGEA
jgi:AbrB family looped-hinge helix DNA binding protein